MTLPVLIVAFSLFQWVRAGPAGLVAALSLAQNGIQVRIVDKSDSFHVHLFLLSNCSLLATPIPTLRAYKLPGGTHPVKTWDLYEKSGVWLDRPCANGACLGQDLLEGVLRDHLAKHGVSVELNKGLVVIEQDAATVTAAVAVFRNGVLTDEKEEVVAQYLIGSDGAKDIAILHLEAGSNNIIYTSNSKKLLGLTFQGGTRDADGMVWGDVTIKGLTSEFWHIWGKPGHFTIMARPLSPTGDKFGIGITGQNFDLTHLADPAKAVEFIKAETGRVDFGIGEFTWLSHFMPNMRMVNKFQEGRTFIVGDSAHVHSPTGGQGMNCSVQDASNLAWKLSLVLNGLASPTILSTYNEELSSSSHKSKEKPAKDTKDDEKASGWFRWRNTALEMYGINYRYSSIVLEERDTELQDAEDVLAHAYSGYEGRGSLRAGDRAPDAPLGGTTLFSSFKSTVHTVLIFSKWSADLEAELKTLPSAAVRTFVITGANEPLEGVSILVDSEGHTRKAYMVEEGSPAIVVVRPDSFIDAIVTDVEDVKRYFSKILV
ncbi:FAD binding domain-containing protein [Armillaria fumosa]|nr:FAD binding domain-containing protein [Armillaria fumosa]